MKLVLDVDAESDLNGWHGFLQRKIQMASVCLLSLRTFAFPEEPDAVVEIRGIRQRVRKKQVLTPEHFQTLVANADLRCRS